MMPRFTAQRPPSNRPFFHRILAATAVSFALLVTAWADATPRADGLAKAPAADNPPNAAFVNALADLKRARADAAVLGTTIERAIAVTDAFFSRISLETLGPPEIAELMRERAFDYGGDTAKARAKIAAQRLEAPATAPDIDGALALALRTLLSSPAGIKGNERSELIQATLHHPAYLTLLHGEFGDLALDAACVAGMRDETYRAFVTGVAGQLDATKSAAAAGSVGNYWIKVEQAIPQGEQRQVIRRQLADYVAAALANHGTTLAAEQRDRIERQLALLTSVAAKGESLAGKPAPALPFTWSSEGGWKSLSDLRGKVVVLDFWTTWCGPCIESFPHVAKLAERYRGADVVILGVTSLQGAIHGFPGRGTIDCRGDPEKEMQLMAGYIKAKGITWPIVFSREPVFNPAYGIRGIPTTVVISPDGIVQHVRVGFADAPLVAKIDALLTEFKLCTPAAPAK